MNHLQVLPSDDASAVPAEAALPLRKSLRAKGLLATLALLAYLLGAGLYIGHERGKVLDSVQALEQLARHEKALALAEAAINSALVDTNEAGGAALRDPGSPGDLRLQMENGSRLLMALDEFDPGYALMQRAVARAFEQLSTEPNRAHWIDLREALRRASDALEIRHRQLNQKRDALTLAYQRQYDAVTIESLLLAVVGLVVFGSLAAWFFARLAHDVRRLEEHAGRIVRGSRGVALEVHREDELGRLMHAVNRMAHDLDEREKQIELDGQRRSHQDKMLAVAALAAGVAHEVNNPLAVISGVAQELRAAASPSPAQLEDSAQLILAQAQRASQAARRLADAAAPLPATLDWLDLNAEIKRVVQLMAYDRRYRGCTVELACDPALPALRSAGSAIQHLLMQLLALACEAAADQVRPQLQLATRNGAGRLELHITLPAALDTDRKPVQQQLLLCRAIGEPLGAKLALGQDEQGRPRLKLSFPAAESAD